MTVVDVVYSTGTVEPNTRLQHGWTVGSELGGIGNLTGLLKTNSNTVQLFVGGRCTAGSVNASDYNPRRVCGKITRGCALFVTPSKWRCLRGLRSPWARGYGTLCPRGQSEMRVTKNTVSSTAFDEREKNVVGRERTCVVEWNNILYGPKLCVQAHLGRCKSLLK